MQAAQQYGVSMDDLANATGYSSAQINDYFSNAGLGSMGTQSTPSQSAGEFTVPPPENIPQTVMPNEGLNELEYPVDSGMYRQPDPASLGMMNVPQTTETSSISPELLRKIQENMGTPFGSQATNQDELMKLLQALKAR